jgi:mono/diheme cytochrome c family protein
MARLLGSVVLVTLAAGLQACSPAPELGGPGNSRWGEGADDDDDDAPRDAGVLPQVCEARPSVRDAGSAIGKKPPARLTDLLTAASPPPPISGGTIAVSSDGMKVVAADPDRDNIYVIDPETAVFQTISVDKGSEPGRVVLDGSSRAHVVLRNKSAIVSIDLKTAKIVQQTTVCSQPRGIAFDRDNAALLVACASGELTTLSAATHAELARTFVALDLRDVLVTKTGERFVSRYRSAELLKLSADGSVATLSAPMTAQEARVSNVSDVSFPLPTSDVVSPGACSAVGPTPTRSAPSGVVAVSMSPTLAWKTIAGADGLPLMVHQQSQDDEVVIQQAGGYGGGGSSCDTISHPAVTKYDVGGTPGPALRVNASGSIVDVAQSPDGKWLAFAQPGAFLGGARGTVAVVGATSSALSDASASVDPASLKPCVVNQEWGNDIQATAVTFDPDGKLYVFSREPAQLSVFTQTSVDASLAQLEETLVLPLSDVSVRDTGHELFHADVGTGLSCVSCHGEALDDGHVWNFQNFGPRRTQNIRGGLLSTLPLHWEGDLSTFQNLVDEVMTRRMGGFAVEPRYSDALASWIDKTPALKLESAHTPDTDATVARGKALFESAEATCASCHSGPALTNNQTVDVGTGGNFQVPSLHGLALRAPFMHDGCAKTLADRFDPGCGGASHGNTAQLSEADKLDLISYLETL